MTANPTNQDAGGQIFAIIDALYASGRFNALTQEEYDMTKSTAKSVLEALDRTRPVGGEPIPRDGICHQHLIRGCTLCVRSYGAQLTRDKASKEEP